MGKRLKNLWEVFSVVIGVYTVYRQIQMADELRKEVYSNLSPEEKARIDEAMKSLPINLPPPIQTSSAKAVSDVDKIKAGV